MLKASLTAILILICGTASGNDYPNWLVAMANSESGGVIELTAAFNDQCTDGWHIAATFTTTRRPIYGCWKFNDSGLTIAWNDGTLMTYDLDDFEWATWATGSNDDADAPPHPAKLKAKSGDTLT